MSVGENNLEIRTKKKGELRSLENQYVDSILDNLDKLVEEKKNELVEKIQNYSSNCKMTRYTKEGRPFSVPNISPVVIKNYFFKSINPLTNSEPQYSAEKLGIVWNLYKDMVTEINIRIGPFTPNITTFCEFAGITVGRFKSYKKSDDEQLRIVVEKIEDSCYDSNVTLAQNNNLNGRMTIYRMKSEQERIEKEQPQIHIHENNKVNLSDIASRLEEITKFNQKKNIVEGKGEEMNNG